MHGSEAPSPWVARWAHLVPTGGTVLDVACGLGRHAVYFAQRNHALVVIDRTQAAIESVANRLPENTQCITADIENGPWPLVDSAGTPLQFSAVVVTNYLWRALFPTLMASVAPGGLLIYETFAVGNESVGKPSRPDFLLQPGELLAACSGLRVIAYENGFVPNPERFVQRIVAVRDKTDALSHGNGENSASISSPKAPVRYTL